MTAKTPHPFISIIVPVFNEKDNVVPLYQEILEVCRSFKKPFEIIFVDDGSSDGTSESIKKLSPVTLITFRRNYGQTAALDAGIKAASGKYIVTMDGDLQNDPADIPKLLKIIEDRQVDFVCGWRKDRHDPLSKKIISAGARWIRSWLVKDRVHDSGCTLRIYRRECFLDLTLRGEMHRFIPALLIWRGFKVEEMPVNHRSRIHGRTKYNFRRTIKGFLDMLNLWFFHKFSSRPLHFLGGIGLFFSTCGVALLGILLVIRLFFLIPIMSTIWPLMAIFLTLFGFQMFVSGLIMDLIISSQGKNLYQVRETRQY